MFLKYTYFQPYDHQNTICSMHPFSGCYECTSQNTDVNKETRRYGIKEKENSSARELMSDQRIAKLGDASGLGRLSVCIRTEWLRNR